MAYLPSSLALTLLRMARMFLENCLPLLWRIVVRVRHCLSLERISLVLAGEKLELRRKETSQEFGNRSQEKRIGC